MYKKILILFMFLLLTACSNLINESNNIEVDTYEPIMEGYNVSYSIDATTQKTSDDFKSKNLLYVPENEVLKISYGNKNVQNEESKVIMKVFYDYKQIDFKLTDEDNYLSEYKFDLESGKKIDIPILLDNDFMIFDNNMHKILVAFTTGSEQNASYFDSVTDEYGINTIYDVVHNLDYTDHMIPYSFDYLLPENNYEKEYTNLTFNTDYNNATQNSEFGGVLKPTPSLTVKRGSNFPLMYNLNKSGSENVLLLFTLNFEQVNINNKYAELIKLDGKTGTANGTINLKMPETPGKYEAIGYVIHNPYSDLSGKSNLFSSSYRFTFIVE